MTSEPDPKVDRHREAGAVGEPDTLTPTRRLIDRIAGLTRTDTGWADEHAETKRAEIETQDDNT